MISFTGFVKVRHTIYTRGSILTIGAGIGISSDNENFSPEVGIILRNTKKVIGILCVYSFKKDKSIEDTDIQFCRLSSQVAPSLESAELHQVKMDNLKNELLKKAENLKIVNDKLEVSNSNWLRRAKN